MAGTVKVVQLGEGRRIHRPRRRRRPVRPLLGDRHARLPHSRGGSACRLRCRPRQEGRGSTERSQSLSTPRTRLLIRAGSGGRSPWWTGRGTAQDLAPQCAAEASHRRETTIASLTYPCRVIRAAQREFPGASRSLSPCPILRISLRASARDARAGAAKQDQDQPCEEMTRKVGGRTRAVASHPPLSPLQGSCWRAVRSCPERCKASFRIGHAINPDQLRQWTRIPESGRP